MSCVEALQAARERMGVLAERHRLEQDALFRELVAAFATDPAAAVAEAAPAGGTSTGACRSASPKMRQVQFDTPLSTGDAQPHELPSQEAGGPQEKADPWSPGHVRTQVWEDKAFHHIDSGHLEPTKGLQRMEHALENMGLDAKHCVYWLLEPMIRLFRWVATQREPRRDSLLARIVDGKWFSMFCFVVIAANAVFIIVATDYEITDPTAEMPSMLLSFEIALVVFYFIELALKLLVHRLFFFVGADSTWNCLDTLLVVFSLMDVVLSGAASTGVNVTFMRSLRLFKLAKVLRVFRSVRFFSELRLMFDCILGSLVSLVWCFAMVVFVAYVFSLLIVQGIAHDLRMGHGSYREVEEELLAEFGSVGQGMLALLKSTTGGNDWGETYDLLSRSPGFVPVAFVVYVVFFALAAWNIVTGLCVERALKIAQPDVETLAMEQNMQDIEDAEELTNIFSEVDADKSGTISLQELENVMTHPKFRSYLRVRGIEIQDARLFYRMMASVVGGDGDDIDMRFVVAACLRMKGPATSMDLHALTFESKLLNKKHKMHIETVKKRLSHIEDCLNMITGEGTGRKN